MKILFWICLGMLSFSSGASEAERSLDEIRAASYSFPEMVAARNFLEINPNEEAAWLHEQAAKRSLKRKSSKKVSAIPKKSTQPKVPVQQDIAQVVTPEEKPAVVTPQKTVQIPDKES